MEEDLYHIRHSLAHLLATAALEHDPRARLSVGPVTDNGFYYDIDFSEGKTPNPDDLKIFEKRMRTLVNKKLSFVRKEVSIAEAREHFAGNPYKLTILDDLGAAGATVSLYTTGDFTDLCEGRHVENTGEIDAKSFTLTHLAGAYFRGDESKPMLTRVYGLAFSTGEELKAYLAQQEEAKKRDHRKLGKELGLFVFSELVGPGLPLWTPKGTIIRELLNDYVWELRKSYGYQKVTIPHITKKDLYETSGHWSKFSDELFKVKTREEHLYALKPMNCPHHTQIFAAEQRSYRTCQSLMKPRWSTVMNNGDSPAFPVSSLSPRMMHMFSVAKLRSNRKCMLSGISSIVSTRHSASISPFDFHAMTRHKKKNILATVRYGNALRIPFAHSLKNAALLPLMDSERPLCMGQKSTSLPKIPSAVHCK
jgi:threonyl-tRNA synthetase